MYELIHKLLHKGLVIFSLQIWKSSSFYFAFRISDTPQIPPHEPSVSACSCHGNLVLLQTTFPYPHLVSQNLSKNWLFSCETKSIPSLSQDEHSFSSCWRNQREHYFIILHQSSVRGHQPRPAIITTFPSEYNRPVCNFVILSTMQKRSVCIQALKMLMRGNWPVNQWRSGI